MVTLTRFFQMLDRQVEGRSQQSTDRFELRRLLNKLSKASGAIPPSIFLKNVSCSDRETLQIGGYADIFQGTCQGKLVALKRLRVSITVRNNRRYIEVGQNHIPGTTF